RRKMSEAMRKRAKTPEFRKMIMERAKKYRGKNNNKARSVICINTGEVFDTLTEASDKYGISTQAIHKACIGEYKSAGMYTIGKPLQFAYFEKSKKYELQEIRGLFERKKVVLTNTGEVFESATEGAEKYSLSQGSISSCCRGKIKSAGKLPNGEYSVWVYEEDYDPNKDYSFHRHKGAHNPRAKKVICLTTGEVF